MRKILILFLTVFSFSAHAEWTSFGKYMNAELFIDPAKLSKQTNMMSVWYYLSFDQATSVPQKGPMQSILFHSFYSCEQHSRAVESISNYSGKNLTGEMNFKRSAESAVFEDIPANSMDEAILKFACSKYKK
jgi:hypothetical protein